MEALPHRTQAVIPLSQQKIQPSLGPRHTPSIRVGPLSPRPSTQAPLTWLTPSTPSGPHHAEECPSL